MPVDNQQMFLTKEQSEKQKRFIEEIKSSCVVREMSDADFAKSLNLPFQRKILSENQNV